MFGLQLGEELYLFNPYRCEYNIVLSTWLVSHMSLYLSLYRWIWHNYTFRSVSWTSSIKDTAHRQSTDACNFFFLCSLFLFYCSIRA